MKLYEFGTENEIKIMCLPGNFMTHRQFENIVPLLETDYHVITVSFDGYDETGETTYTTAQEQAEKLAKFIRDNLDGKIDLVYAESLGSIPAAYLTRFRDLEIGGVILSGAEYMSTWEQNPDICIACWYGEKEMNMKKAIKHLTRAFPNIRIRPFKGLGHGEIMTQPELLVSELKKFIESN